jgi:hypothetical protein
MTPRDDNNYVEFTKCLVKNNIMYCVFFGGNRPVIRVCTVNMSGDAHVDCVTVNNMWAFRVSGVSSCNERSTMMDVSHDTFRAMGFDLNKL